MECPICYEDMPVPTHLKCGHAFHRHCIDRWAEEHCTCPYCRAVFHVKRRAPDTPMCFMMFTIITYTYLFFIVAFRG